MSEPRIKLTTPRPQHYTFERVCLCGIEVTREATTYDGTITILDLDTGKRTPIRYFQLINDDTLEELAKLRELVYPTYNDDKSIAGPPPTVSITVSIELDETLRYIRHERLES